MCVFVELQSGKEHSGRLGSGLILLNANYCTNFCCVQLNAQPHDGLFIPSQCFSY
jgi:hypothetical protein